ncbi:serine/threonine-protein kinase WNK2-like isoform X2 [Nannospalax galili]|uniref:serine/threonine-protein kinase WNK2-like isoform X2 n=1 Tax=Nannospalax galili TaxID=1026970 RepID=UPI0004ED6DE5|nr:serine/threonine-protein kinase WNK2-like isoform X2 [Nannospalax galili]
MEGDGGRRDVPGADEAMREPRPQRFLRCSLMESDGEVRPRSGSCPDAERTAPAAPAASCTSALLDPPPSRAGPASALGVPSAPWDPGPEPPGLATASATAAAAAPTPAAAATQEDAGAPEAKPEPGRAREDEPEKEDDEEDDLKAVATSLDGRFLKFDMELGPDSFGTVCKGLDTETWVEVACCELQVMTVHEWTSPWLLLCPCSS